MQQAVLIPALVAVAILVALAASIGMAGAVHLTMRRSQGYMHWIFYAILLLVALGSLLSGRDLSVATLLFEEPVASQRHPLMALAQPLTSALLLLVAGGQIISHWFKRDGSTLLYPGLVLAFIIFWSGTVAAPALFGAHPRLSHDYIYTLPIGIAAVLATSAELDRAIAAARNSFLLFMAISLLVIPFNPGLVLEASYLQGLFPGLPRMVGLAPHAVALGLLAQLALILLMLRPYKRVWFNTLAWTLGLVVIFLAQSKTSWVSFAISALCILGVRSGPSFWRRVGDPTHPGVGVLSVLLFMAALMATALLLMVGSLGDKLSSFFGTTQGAQLVSLTGRDQIWAIAYEEWARNPVFGYGPDLWDASFRISIGMPNAMHGHNQFMDTLSRSGSVGAVSLVLYALVLLVMSIRYARASGGLTLALFVVLLLRSISEVPLLLFGYGIELIPHVLLLMSLAASVNECRICRSLAGAGGNAGAAFRPSRDTRVASA